MVDYLSDDKIAECKEVFDLYDKDNDGAIGIRELEELFRTLGSNATHDLLTKYLVKHEKEDLSCVSFNDFLSLFVKFKDPDIEEDISSGFEIFDSKNSGTISLKKFVHVLTSNEELNVTDDNTSNSLKITYKGKETIDKETFIQLMLNKDK